jgi:hypothetical protein
MEEGNGQRGKKRRLGESFAALLDLNIGVCEFVHGLPESLLHLRSYLRERGAGSGSISTHWRAMRDSPRMRGWGIR